MRIIHVLRAAAYRMQVPYVSFSQLSIVHQKRVGLGWGSSDYGLGSACLRIVQGAILGILQRLSFLGSIDEGLLRQLYRRPHVSYIARTSRNRKRYPDTRIWILYLPSVGRPLEVLRLSSGNIWIICTASSTTSSSLLSCCQDQVVPS
jgi:hypothetical protein